MSQISDRRDFGAFIPAFLDDYELFPDEFRVYARIARRAGSGKCNESLDRMAKACKIGVVRLREIVNLLVLCGMIQKIITPGKRNEYCLTPHSEWKPSEELEALRSKARKHAQRTKRWREEGRKTTVYDQLEFGEPLITVTTPTPDHGDITTPDHGDITTPDHGDITTPDHGDITTPDHGDFLNRPQTDSGKGDHRSEGTPLRKSLLRYSQEGVCKAPKNLGSHGQAPEVEILDSEPVVQNFSTTAISSTSSHREPERVEADQYSAAPLDEKLLSLKPAELLRAEIPDGCIHPAAAFEARMNPNAFPWKRCSDDMLAAFTQYYANVNRRKGDTPQRSLYIAGLMIQQANNPRSIGTEKYQRVHLAWASFVENAQKSTTVAEATAQTPQVPEGWREFLRKRRERDAS